MDLVLPVGQAFAVLYGLVIGSFLAVCIVRLPEDRSLLVPSACPHCAAKVRWHDNVPVLGWLWLRGRCRSCGEAISPLYPLVELLTALLAWLVFRKVFVDPADLDLAHIVAWVTRFGFLCLLVVAAAVDVRHRIIPDQTSIYAVPFGIAAAALLAWLGFDAVGWPGWQEALLGAAFWGALFAALSLAGRFVMGVDALGWGDVKLVTMFGAFLGVLPGTLLALLFGSLIGSAVGLGALAVQRRRTALPFGPPLALGAAVVALWGDALVPWGS
jgi:leader peptidase (prepilin peptidase) / N-methyltransferase